MGQGPQCLIWETNYKDVGNAESPCVKCSSEANTQTTEKKSSLPSKKQVHGGSPKKPKPRKK
jgi:hypothetical protein